MKLLSVDSERKHFRFRLDLAPRQWFTQILSIYPVLEESLQPNNKRQGKLVQAALARGREKLRERAAVFLRSGALEIDAEFNETWDITLSPEEIEELLQILNNVRVGLWIRNGKPELHPKELVGPPASEAIRDQMVMHVCAAFQGILMEALESPP